MFLSDVSVLVFTYAEGRSTYFHDIGPTAQVPSVGSIIDFDGVPLPVIYSIAVRLDLSKSVRRSTRGMHLIGMLSVCLSLPSRPKITVDQYYDITY